MTDRFLSATAAILLIGVSVTSARAGIITGVQPGGNFDLTGVTPTPQAPNNDDFTGAGATSPNSIGAGKIFGTKAAQLHTFTTANSGGTTEYFFVERVTNQTGVDWLDFHFELITADNRLDFDTGTPQQKTPAPTSTAFTRLNHQPQTIDWDRGLVKNGQFVFFTFSIDVPDGVQSFTLLEEPSLVPEPSGLLLLSGGLTAILVFGRRQLGRDLSHRSRPWRKVKNS
ncbi:MAG: PEP-CTERM sorting domain-containing protein [Bryobacteraceae bacterium]